MRTAATWGFLLENSRHFKVWFCFGDCCSQSSSNAACKFCLTWSITGRSQVHSIFVDSKGFDRTIAFGRRFIWVTPHHVRSAIRHDCRFNDRARRRLIYKLFSCSPNILLGYYAGKLIESAVFCLNKLELKKTSLTRVIWSASQSMKRFLFAIISHSLCSVMYSRRRKIS